MENGVEVDWLGHASFLIKHNGKNIYIDPFQLSRGAPDADLILITHGHYDHLSLDDVEHIYKEDTIIIATPDCRDELSGYGDMHDAHPGNEFDELGYKIKAVKAYNKSKPFHPEKNNWVGFVIDIEGFRIYHAGDTDHIPEMKDIECDLALLPVSGTYVMTPEEAAKAAHVLGASKVIPMHYGAIVGDSSDAKKFKELCDAEVVILEKKVF